MLCSKCGSEAIPGKKFCAECGSPLPNQCANCGSDNAPNAKFCADCGTPLRKDKPPKSTAPSTVNASEVISFAAEQQALEVVEGERKTVTALFADIKGSTELMQDLDPEEARAIIDPALKLMIEAVQRYDGYVVQSTGDGIFALFGAPVAHEDHPLRALYAALRIQEEMRRCSAKLREGGNLPLEARVGVNTGEVVVRTIATGSAKTEYTPIGHTANLASRMQALAPTGSVAVSENTQRLAEGYFVLKPLGPTRVKGLSEPVKVYEVTGLGPLQTRLQRAAGRGLTKFVGREHEMENLKRALEQTKAGHGQIVAAMAEAGVGKSRLFFEFKAVSQAGCMVLETFSVSHGKASAYLPLIDLLRGYFAIETADDSRKRREKVTGRVVALDRALEDTLPYLFALLGIAETPDPLVQMDGQIKKRRTLEAIKRILLRESLNQPLTVIFEDLHWIDGQTQEFLNLLADSIGTAKILLMVNYRPEYSHQWGNKTYYTQLRLDPMGKESAAGMLAALLGDGTELAPLKRLIIEKTEGNPFFMEETAQVLFDEGALVRNGVVKLTKPLAELKIPPTVQGILAARIDRLPANAKDLLQTLAVIGREFPMSLIRAVVPKSEDELNGLLNDLQLGEFIYEQPAVGDTEYIFKHALTQEVAHNSVLSERRKQLHECIGTALEALFGKSIDDHLADVALHYSRGGNDAKAVSYLIRAGEQALQRSAFSQSAAYFEDALGRLHNLPFGAERDREEIAIHSGLADVLMITSGYAAADYERHLMRRQELAEKLGDEQHLFYSLVGMSVLRAFRLELREARAIGDRLVALADQALNPEMQLEAYGSLANILWMTGDILGSLKYAEKGLAVFSRDEYLPPGKEHLRAACLFYECSCAAALGFPDKGLRLSLDFLSRARERAQPLQLTFALNSVTSLCGWRGEGREALKYADAMLAVAAEHGLSNWHAFARIARGHALALLGNTMEAIPEIEGAIAAFEAAGSAIPGWLCAALASAYLTAKQPERGLALVSKALQVADQSGDGEAKSELHRLNGELLVMSDQGNRAEAEECFRAAIAVARAQSVKLPELSATMSLTRLLANQGKRDEARAMIADIYNWFTEGFETADLKGAKALLDELSTPASTDYR